MFRVSRKKKKNIKRGEDALQTTSDITKKYSFLYPPPLYRSKKRRRRRHTDRQRERETMSSKTKKVRVGVNGFGRIGRLAFRLAYENPNLEFVHVNEGVGAGESSAYLVNWDSVHGKWNGHEMEFDEETNTMRVDGGKMILTYSQKMSPGEVDWKSMDIDMVLECSGAFLTREKLQAYFDAGVKKVVVSAPVKDKENPVLNIVYGVNHSDYDKNADHIVTAASCTTNCLAPVIQVILKKVGIVRGSITTIHNVTNTQTIVDAPNSKKSDLRRARSGLVNLAPTSTGSATAIALIFPELKGKLDGLAVRVPLINGSLTDIVLDLPRDVTTDEINGYLKEASENELKDILGFETQPLVSTDYINDTRSSIIDALSTKVVDKRHLKVYAWYDNEYGYSARMADIANMVAESIM